MCTPVIADFINYVFPHLDEAGGQHYYKCYELAQWCSWQSYIHTGTPGALPVSVIITQWGLEWGWNGPDLNFYRNMANQGGTCGWTQCGLTPAGFPRFCNIVDGVKAYSALMNNGYPHAEYGWFQAGAGDAGVRQVCINLGQGYAAGSSLAGDYCGGPCPVISSSCRRIWDAGGYNDGSGPGGMLINTIYSPSNADCLPNLNYIQTSAPPGLGF